MPRHPRERDGRRPHGPSEAPPDAPAHPLLALQRAVGNRAIAALLQRSQVTGPTGAVTGYRFEVGAELPVAFAAAAKAQVAKGGLGTPEMEALRSAALADDQSIDDDEQLFMAGLLDAANMQRVAQSRFAAGDAVEFPAASLTPARRAQVEALGRPGAPGDAPATAIPRLTGRFAPTAAAAVAVAQRGGLSEQELLNGMLRAASDGTPGDLALAACVLTIAHGKGLGVYPDLVAGRIKVDEVPPAAMPGGADHRADYVTIGGGNVKGDTIYLPSDFDIANAVDWSVVVHELNHAEVDKTLGQPGQGAPREDVELAGWRAQAEDLMDRLRSEPPATLDALAKQIGARLEAILMIALIMVSRGDPGTSDPLIQRVNVHARPGQQWSAADLAGALARTEADLEARLLPVLRKAYLNKPGVTPDVPLDGLRGESILDRP